MPLRVVLLLCLAPAFGLAEEPERPNVLFLICDDLNCDLACYGHPRVRSPNIDRLAAGGVRFERAYCQFPLCGPSRASFLSGLYPDRTRILRNKVRIRETLPDVVTMPQHFAAHGYATGRIGKLYHYGVPRDIGTAGHDDPASWQRTFNPYGRDKIDEDQVFTLRPGQFGGTLSWLAADGTDAEQTDGVGAARAADWLREYAEADTPFFLAVGFYRPHTPYVAPEKYFDLYDPESIDVPPVPAGYHDTLPGPAVKTLTRKKDQNDLSDELARQAIAAYWASNTFVDARVGQVLDALDETGLADSTIVVFTSDHGYHMGEHGFYQKPTLFENAARVPLIVRVPGGASGVAAGMAEMVDLYPTLADLCGLPVPERLAGDSLAATVREPATASRDDALTQTLVGKTTGYSLRTDRWRYTSWGSDGHAGVELYDHRSDPAEMHNLADDPATESVRQRLSQRLAERVAAAQR